MQTDLTGHHNERRGEPVVVEHLAGWTAEGEVEADWRGGLQVRTPEPDEADRTVAQQADLAHLNSGNVTRH